MSFGERVRDLRRQSDMTQRDLADKLKINFTYISKIESGKIDVLPSEDLIRRIATILNTDAEELLELAGKLDLKLLQQIAMEKPKISALLRRIQSGKITEDRVDMFLKEETDD